VAPARVASLTLAAPAGVGHESAINFRLATVPLLGELLTWPTRMGLRQLWRSAYAVPSRIEAERLEAKLADARAPGAQAAFLKTLRGFLALGGFPQDQVDALRDDLPSLRSPTLVVWGQQDHLLPVEHGRQLARAMPNAELLVLDDCGHLPQIEASERFNAALLNFLDTVDATSARLM
jgi:pimeloyl-ACP methyl ester carboxylesterase